MNEIIVELNCRIDYYKQLAEDRKVVDPEISNFYRGSAAALNLFASWLERKHND